MGIVYKIVLPKPVDGFYRAGQCITGTVKYTVDEPTNCDSIVISLIGKARCRFQNIAYNNKLYLTGNEEFITRHINILDKPAEVIVPIGAYEYPFEFNLPENIPSTYKFRAGILSPYNHICDISYYLKIRIGKTQCFGISQTSKTEIIVYGNVDPITPDGITYTLEKVLFRPLSSKNHVVHLKIEAVKTFLRQGESVELKLNVTNDTDCIINTIKMKMIRRLTLTSNCGNKGVFRQDIDLCTSSTASIQANTETTISSTVPTISELYSVHHSKIILVEYVIKVTIVLPLPHKNASVEIPLVIG